MGIDNSNLREKLNKIFVDKYADYLDLMKVAGCTNEDLATKSGCLIEFDGLTDSERAKIVKDDMSFLDFFTSGGLVCSDESGKRLYEGINKEIAHSVVCTMSSLKQNVELSREYADELEEPVTLPNVRDMISQDMSMIFPDIKKLFFLGEKDAFHNRMTKIFTSEDLEVFCDIVDASVYKKGESGVYQYMDMIENAITKERELNQKGLNL